MQTFCESIVRNSLTLLRQTYTGGAKKMYTHFKRCYLCITYSKDGVNQMNASVTMRQAGQSKKMSEARLSFEEHKTILKWCLKCVYIFLAPSVYESREKEPAKMNSPV